MKKTILGKTNAEVSRVVFGGIIVNGETQNGADRFVSEAVDMGVNFFDVAPNYGEAEEKLGPALEKYRKNVFLSCKTFEKTADGARKNLENSFKMMRTDYFDLYQLHSLAEVSDVDKVFAKDGAMQVVDEAKKSGRIKHVGITAHNEETALYALTKYDYDTVMFPINWALDLRLNFASRLYSVCADKNIGLIAIKALAHRNWKDDEERVFPKSWCKTIFNNDSLGVSALKYTLSKGVHTIVPPGNFEQFKFVVNHIDECCENPFNENDMKLLKSELPEASELFFKVTEDKKGTFENR